jgi:hypothetical protein
MADKSCFFIAPIGEPESPIRRKSDQVLRHVVRAAVEPLGYTAQRADELDEEGLITNQIIERLIDGDLVVADLSGRNPNVFYELAVRHAAQKPVVHLIAYDETLPFDVANVRAVPYALEDPDLLAEARRQVTNKVRAIEGSSEPSVNPITAARQLQLLRTSGDPDTELTGTVLTALASMRTEIQALSERVWPAAARRPPEQTPAGPRGSLRVGLGVEHAAFGPGVIVGVDDPGITIVRFEVDGTERKLLWDYAPIKLTGESLEPPPPEADGEDDMGTPT